MVEVFFFLHFRYIRSQHDFLYTSSKGKYDNFHFQTRRNLSETGRKIHLPRKQLLINQKDIDTRRTKAWTAIDRLSIIWKSDLTDKMKRTFFQAAVVLILLYGCTTWTLTKRLRRTLTTITQECCEQY